MSGRGLVVPRRSRAVYALALARRPAMWGGIVVSLVIGATVGGAIAVPMVAAIAAATLMSAGSSTVQHRVDAAREREALRQRREVRETRLEDANVRRAQLTTVTDLVDEILRSEHPLVSASEMEAWLDRYAELLISAAQVRRLINATSLTRVPQPASTPARNMIAYHRMMQLQRCLRSCAALEEELVSIENRLRSLADRLCREARARTIDAVLAKLDAP